MKRLFCALFCLLISGSAAPGQALYAASRVGDLQIGAGYTNASSDYEYSRRRLAGVCVYTNFDFKGHFGVDVTFHQLFEPHSSVYQRTYEVGGRYVRRYGRLSPYLKGFVGRGVLNFPNDVGNLGYNLFGGSAGTDLAVRPSVNLRVEFEYQNWMSAPGSRLSLQPSLVSVGMAYHFAAGTPR